MSNNLFICFDDTKAIANPDALKQTIQSLGNITQLIHNVWYVNSRFNAEEAIKILSRGYPESDKVLMVINATTDSVTWMGLADYPAKRINQNWKMNIPSVKLNP